jgi:hypothetical protein
VYDECRVEQLRVASNSLYAGHEIEVRQPYLQRRNWRKEVLRTSSTTFCWSWLLLNSARLLGSNFLSKLTGAAN